MSLLRRRRRPATHRGVRLRIRREGDPGPLFDFTSDDLHLMAKYGHYGQGPPRTEWTPVLLLPGGPVLEVVAVDLDDRGRIVEGLSW